MGGDILVETQLLLLGGNSMIILSLNILIDSNMGIM